MSTISNNDIAEAIYLASEGKNKEEQSLISSKTLKMLVRRRLLQKAPNILERLNKIINEREGRVVVKLSSKGKLSEKIKKELEHSLLLRYRAKEISFIENSDEKLLGGFKIEVNDEVIDLTIKNKIDKLQEYLTESI